jgi:hypothetical protein
MMYQHNSSPSRSSFLFFFLCALDLFFPAHSDCAQVDIDRCHPARVLELSRATVAEREHLSVNRPACIKH